MNKTKTLPVNSDMRFEVSTKCNYNCVICPRDKLTRRIETMGLALFKKLFDKINQETVQYDTLTFPGLGEPLLDKTIDAKIAYAKKKKRDISVLILSNGSSLTPERFRQLESIGVSSIRISLHGNDIESYAKAHRIRNGHLFYIIRDNLLKICKMRRATKLLLTFNVINGANDNVVDSWVNFWSDKVDLIEVWRPHNWVNGRNYREMQSQKLKTCGRPFRGPLQVQVDGTVNMCCFDFDGKLTLGDLKNQSLKEIFSSSLYRKIVKCHSSGNFNGSSLICKNCDQRNKSKDGIMIYSSKFDISERIRMTSTTYQKVA